MIPIIWVIFGAIVLAFIIAIVSIKDELHSALTFILLLIFIVIWGGIFWW